MLFVVLKLLKACWIGTDECEHSGDRAWHGAFVCARERERERERGQKTCVYACEREGRRDKIGPLSRAFVQGVQTGSCFPFDAAKTSLPTRRSMAWISTFGSVRYFLRKRVNIPVRMYRARLNNNASNLLSIMLCEITRPLVECTCANARHCSCA